QLIKMLVFLLRDRWIRVSLLAWLAIALFYVSPFGSFELRTFVGDSLLGLIFLPLIAAACLDGASTIVQTEERRFWRMLAAAYLVWFAFALIAAALPTDDWTVAAQVAGDCAFLTFYLLFLLAVELKP